MARPTKPRAFRVLWAGVPERFPTDRRYLVCTGLDKPVRGAWWRVVGTYKTKRGADGCLDALPQSNGRALIDTHSMRVDPISELVVKLTHPE